MRADDIKKDAEIIEKAIFLHKSKNDILKKAKEVMPEKKQKLFKETQLLEKALEDYQVALYDNVDALQSNIAARKSIKIDPAIAGGLADGVAGLGAGLYAAASSAERNEMIDYAREETQKQVDQTTVVSSMQRARVIEVYHRILGIIDENRELSQFYNDLLKVEDERKAVLESAKRETEKNNRLIGIVAFIVLFVLTVVLDSVLLAMALFVPAFLLTIFVIGQIRSRLNDK